MYYLVFEFANTTNGTLQNFFDEDSFLWMNALIVAILKLPVYLNVLDIEHSKILEHLVLRPLGAHDLASFIELLWFMLILHLLLQLVHCILQLQINCTNGKKMVKGYVSDRERINIGPKGVQTIQRSKKTVANAS